MACNRCDRFIKSSSITASSSDVIITISSAPTLTNLKRFCLVLAQNLPEGANTLPVQISIGGTTYPVYTRTGNKLEDQASLGRLLGIVTEKVYLVSREKRKNEVLKNIQLKVLNY